MSFPEIENRTPFAVAPVYLADEEGRPLLIMLTRATLRFDFSGKLFVADTQLGIKPAGIFNGEPGNSSYKYEPDAVLSKVATDVVLIGSACAPRMGATEVDVTLQIGPVHKTVRVFGDRYWVNGGAHMTQPEPFERIPLQYERAFGGWDRGDPDPARHEFEPRNPVGRGFCAKNSTPADAVALPNLEDPRNLIADCHDCPSPAGFGFTAPEWQPRAQFAGTHDAKWASDRAPLLPTDFDRRYFSAASSGLIAPGYLRGDESILVRGVSHGGDLQISLPAIAHIDYQLLLRGQSPRTLVGKLDTLVIDTDESQLHLTWRAECVVPRGPQDALELEVGFS
jgi:hypothetical protein